MTSETRAPARADARTTLGLRLLAALVAAVMAAAVTGGVPARSASAADRPLTSTVSSPRTVGYGPDARQVYDAYLPAGSRARRPAVLLIHGGSWARGDKRQMRSYARKLYAAGYVSFSMNYRLTSQAAWPAQRDDVHAALRHIKANAKRYRIDPARIGVIGASAGGHLALAVASHGTGRRFVKAAVALSAPTQLHSMGAGVRPSLVSDVRKLCGTCKDARVPRHASAGDAPALLFNSSHELIPASHAWAYRAAYARLRDRVPVTVRILEGSHHGRNFGPHQAAVWQQTLRFLRRHV
jgi:acetyl esterase/lipase